MGLRARTPQGRGLRTPLTLNPDQFVDIQEIKAGLP